jgi:hypothetical protein
MGVSNGIVDSIIQNRVNMKSGLEGFLSLFGSGNWRFRMVVLVVAFLLYGVYLYCAWAGYPNPFVDEAFFVPPALSFSQSYSFFSIHLDPSRALHWMPVGYAVLCGLFMKLSGVAGFWGARLFSSVAYGLALLMLTLIGKRFNKAQVLALHMPFLTLPLLTLARLGRMEALFLLLVLISMLFMLRRRMVAAVAVSLLSGLVHPNGAYVLAGCLVLLLVQLRGEGVRQTFASWRKDMPLLIIALGCGLAYLAYELMSYQYFLVDMSYQFKRKARGVNLFSMLSVFSMASMAAAGVLIRYAYTWERAVLVVFGAGLMLMRVIGQEIWYSPGYIVGLTLIVVAALGALPLRASAVPTSRASQGWLALLGVASLGVVFVFSSFVQGWHGGRIDTLGSGSQAVDDARLVESVVQKLRGMNAGDEHGSFSCMPFQECLLLMKPATEAGLLVRLNNPVTAPPIGKNCVWISRANAAPSTDAELRLDSGPIKHIDIRPCGPSWESVERSLAN